MINFRNYNCFYYFNIYYIIKFLSFHIFINKIIAIKLKPLYLKDKIIEIIS